MHKLRSRALIFHWGWVSGLVSQCTPLYTFPGFEFFEASAKENINVKQVFERLVDIICEKMNESLEPSASNGSNGKGPSLGDSPAPQTGGCSC